MKLIIKEGREQLAKRLKTERNMSIEKAREEAVNAFKAMVWLEQITPVEGFVARAIWSISGDQDKRARHGSGGLPAKWYPTDDGKWYWKGDTSSDEMMAHYYSVTLFHDIAAKGKEKELAKQHIIRMTNHILDNGYKLIDMDGQPTRWGRWDPDYLFKPYGMYARGLNGMEVQTFLRSAMAFSEDIKYDELDEVTDEINQRFGKLKIHRGRHTK